MSQLRAFISIDIPFAETLKKLHKEIIKTQADVKLVEPDNVHITLKFLGEIHDNLIEDINKIIESSVEQIKPFTITLFGTGAFPNKDYMKVLWIGIKNTEQIQTLAQNIDEQLTKLGFKKETRGFSAHLTIGRVRSARQKEKLQQIIQNNEHTEFIEIKVDSIKLKQSTLTPQGPIYTTIKEIKL